MSATEPTDAARQAWAAVQGAMGLLILAAVAAQARATVERTVGLGRDLPTTMANFFSYFTILSNIFCAVVLLLAAWWMTRPRSKPQEAAWLAILLACATTYMIATGVVYNLLLRSIALDQGTTVPWSNEVLHLLGPAFMLLHALCGPWPRTLPGKSVALVLIFPLAWLGYTLIRAPFVTAPATGVPWWYPYPFLDHTCKAAMDLSWDTSPVLPQP
ncbi:Pr6Pr family membrane protein [Glutamicibacter protophormiae]|uniref:Glucan phosphoethanolaminetransferase (Alkaline phosphatase superfamily) n=1 Tax=Glutamicibacter protophormiae TaxID=37930 RepID=A0ABS4XNA2_GLUPR|nr:Pr6Pr family membrane protein [Glutamicibacter protophormiae]MBP2397998.1 glucan phosphoethanolaminetransferase (alkaline phosphatase superfamily) [Glutamicibacter protophormiae]GGL96752.1 hypothetical protein GCM10010038_28720 [Glutamicibacter protophormiae]